MFPSLLISLGCLSKILPQNNSLPGGPRRVEGIMEKRLSVTLTSKGTQG